MRTLGERGVSGVLTVQITQSWWPRAYNEGNKQRLRGMLNTDWMVATWLLIVAALPYGTLLDKVLDAVVEVCEPYVIIEVFIPFYFLLGATVPMVWFVSCGTIFGLPLYRTYTWITEITQTNCTRLETATLTIRWSLIVAMDVALVFWLKHLARDSNKDGISFVLADITVNMMENLCRNFLSFLPTAIVLSNFQLILVLLIVVTRLAWVALRRVVIPLNNPRLTGAATRFAATLGWSCSSCLWNPIYNICDMRHSAICGWAQRVHNSRNKASNN